MDLTPDFTSHIWALSLYFPRVADFSPLCATKLTSRGGGSHRAPPPLVHPSVLGTNLSQVLQGGKDASLMASFCFVFGEKARQALIF